MKRAVVLSVIVGIGAMAMGAAWLQAQQQPPQGPNVAQIEKLKDNLYMITGGGGNTAAFITVNGVVLVDTKLANWGQAILDKVKTVTDKPITHIINTHTHGDHVGSNEFFPANVEIVAHANTQANMMKMPAFQDAAKKYGMPDRTFKDKMSLLGGNEAIDLYYFGPGHTNGDALIVFRALRVMHAGDLFARKGAPNCDVNNGGTCLAYGDTVAKAATGIKDVDTIITGHSTVMKWPDLAEYGEFNRAFVQTVRASQKAGKTVDQAVAELKLPDKFKDFDMMRAKTNVEIIYKELQR